MSTLAERAETQLDRIEQTVRIVERLTKENRQALDRLQRLIERIAGKE